MVEFRDLEVLYWIVKLGGFRKAATRLHTTQPAISNRIAQIERQYGITLFERGRRKPVTLTARGLTFFKHAEHMLRLHEAFLVSLKGAETLTGTVRLGVSETLVHTWLSGLVQDLLQTHPGVGLDISVDISATLQDGLNRGELDLAFMLDGLAPAKAVTMSLCDYPLEWVASPALPVAAGTLDLRHLAAWPILTYSSRTQPYQQISALFKDPALGPVRLFGNGSLASIVRLATDGMGIGAIPPVTIREELTTGRLRILNTAVKLPTLRFAASYLDGPGARLAAMVAGRAREVAARY